MAYKNLTWKKRFLNAVRKNPKMTVYFYYKNLKDVQGKPTLQTYYRWYRGVKK